MNMKNAKFETDVRLEKLYYDEVKDFNPGINYFLSFN